MGNEIIRYYCPKCGTESKGNDFCSACGHRLTNTFQSSIKKPVRYFIKSNTNRNKTRFRPIYLGVISTIIVFVGLIWQFFTVRPSDKILFVGNHKIILSAESQQFLHLYGSSTSDNKASVIIINEPHFNIEEQRNLLKGLFRLFFDNYDLRSEVVFLAEGVESGVDISVSKLSIVNQNPSPETVDIVLQSFLIPAYIAYDWCQESHISIKGTENYDLYKTSARLWTNNDQHEKWLTSVVLRNRKIADAAISAVSEGKVVFLFIGGKHLYPLHTQTFNTGLSELRKDQDYQNISYTVQESKNIGVVDYLKAKGIGYYFIQAFSNEEDANLKKEADQYRALFKAQIKGEYKTYISDFINKHLYINNDIASTHGVTTTPATDAAAELVKTLNSVEQKDKKGGNQKGDSKENKSQEKKPPAPGKPTEKDGYIPPKKPIGDKNDMVKNPNGFGKGWSDIKGDVWVPTGGKATHGGEHWDVQTPGKGGTKGSHRNVLPGGKVR